MAQTKILWVDDEIDMLKPHIIFLEQKGYIISTATNGSDALEMVTNENFDVIFLDENMPGLSGIETMEKIKDISPLIPIVMITKSEEENIMDEAIGSKISDFLIKPVNPNQIILVLKKIIDKQRLVSQKITSSYQSEFTKLGMEINETYDFSEWIDVYKKLTNWELKLSESDDSNMDEIIHSQLKEANYSFAKYIKKNYISWFDNKNTDKIPLFSQNLLSKKVFPYLKNNEKVVFLLLDNLRFDQWKIIEPLLSQYYTIEEEDLYYSILPTATQYSRNSIFSGLMPYEINMLYPELWKNDEEEGGKNLYEEEMLHNLMKRHNVLSSVGFEKLLDISYTKKIIDNLHSLMNNQFNVLIVNFMDALSHASTEQKSIKELASSLNSYRAITKSWFEHSNIFEIIKILSNYDYRLIISTDHGSIKINNPVKIIGDKDTTTNLRYKQGKNLSYNPKEVFEILNPQQVHLPKTNFTSTYVFAYNNDFFAYPNNYNYFVKYYKDSFQHGGISLEEMIIPVISLKPKK
ncbi:MAG: PglZ domain-containing protein [Bacteroidales bacterium]|jgi:CheY-like chemotaxis protein|nr:PglZ domain-containing protein [Bacteroidales bacterium]